MVLSGLEVVGGDDEGAGGGDEGAEQLPDVDLMLDV